MTPSVTVGTSQGVDTHPSTRACHVGVGASWDVSLSQSCQGPQARFLDTFKADRWDRPYPGRSAQRDVCESKGRALWKNGRAYVFVVSVIVEGSFVRIALVVCIS